MSASRTIQRLAIVNRGEAAVRCLRAVKALRAAERSSLEAVALYTEVDRTAPFVRHADLALPLPPRLAPVAAYLDHDAVLETLTRAGCDAVWPGWGFVAEDPVFADRVRDAGLAFLGPRGDTMRALGDKIAAKRLAESAGVPVSPWSAEAVETEEVAAKHAERIGFPLMVKASAGGGGRGIRVVTAGVELGGALRAAKAEARGAFGDERVFLERKIEAGRHIEVQIAADLHGRVLALGCRDCSVQRRHQKLIEEAPPPALAPGLQEGLERAAVQLASHVGYEGLGTVEFLVTPDAFFFLEMNPRLQVEHGITEETTGLDLVQLQIRIARGEPLPERAPASRGFAIEARVCAEDPDAGFLPAPGLVARFEPALGPRLRIDAGVATGTPIPAEFDSLVAKLIASGDTREEARARLACALRDMELVVAGGATNKGALLEVLESDDFRKGGVDTGWLDRFVASPREGEDFAAPALVAAAILTYQRRRLASRVNFYADPANASPDRTPASVGQQLELSHGGLDYKLQVYALGAWRYRVWLDGRAVSATLREDGQHAARLTLCGRTLRLLHDATDVGLRLEIDGHPHKFGWQGAGEVRAGTPALVVAVHVGAGDRVETGQAIGLLEAMKTEIAFHAPVSGVVREVAVRRGQQVAAGDVLLRIDSTPEAGASVVAHDRIALWEEPDPLAPLFKPKGAGLGAPDLAGHARRDEATRRAALDALREEIRRVLLGYDVDAERAEKLAAFLEAELPKRPRADLLDGLADRRREIVLFADLEQLFIRTPRASVSGELGPSNAARLRMFVRRMRAGGAGIAEEFLALVRHAMAHYGVLDLASGDALERAMLRLFASQRAPRLRRRLVLGLVRRLTTLAKLGRPVRDDPALADALERIASMRQLVGDALADAAVEARHALFERPAIERDAKRASKEVEAWLATAETAPSSPPGAVLAYLAAAPPEVFARVGRWLGDADARRRAIALSTHLRRLYVGSVIWQHASGRRGEHVRDRLELGDGRIVFGSAAAAGELQHGVERLVAEAAAEGAPGAALELLVPEVESADVPRLVEALRPLLPGQLGAARLTLGFVGPDGAIEHRTFEAGGNGSAGALRERDDLHGLHPELAARLGLERLRAFELERLEARDGIVAFHARSRAIPDDERIFVLADVRGRLPGGADDALDLAGFERVFYEATRRLRSFLALRDPDRRLQWNRLTIFVSPAVRLDGPLVERLAQRLEPATHHLGLEKVVVRVALQGAHGEPPRASEIVIADPTGSHMELTWREPHDEPLRPASVYERKVVEARRRRLVYPYEIVRMLTSGGRGRFEEWDLEPTATPSPGAAPAARPVPQRPPGANESGVVFGILTTPTELVPEGLRRVLVLSDPTRGMGALAAPECERLVAAIDLAEREGLPVEWVPVSSGAKIAMDSGTENLDATARVVKRIVELTDAGGTIHVIVHGVNVGAQSYFDALATMGLHTRGALVMTPGASLVLTGRAALEASGSVAAEDELGIGGFERIMGPNGEAHYYARDLGEAFRVLSRHYEYTYVVPGEKGPRRKRTGDASERDVTVFEYAGEAGEPYQRVGELFDAASNPERKRPFSMRAVMRAVVDQDGGRLERWRAWVGAETAIVWDARVGGFPVTLIGVESRPLAREGYRPPDGPATWTGGTLFPLSSKKIARALNAASGNRAAVILANLSGFDGSPESMRKLQLEYGAEIARAVVRFRGPLLFLVVSRYHGGAYVVFSRSLNPRLRAGALEGSFASVIGGGPAATVVLAREVRARAAADLRVSAARDALVAGANGPAREAFDRLFADVVLEKQRELAAEFDAVHTVERARRVGSLEEILPAAQMRPWLVAKLEEELG